MIYLCAGLFAEGKTDYDFLLPLIPRLLDEIGARVCPGAYEVAPAIGIDSPESHHEPRAERIARAVSAYWSQCLLFIIHTDGAGDTKRAHEERVEPGLVAARRAAPTTVAAAACIPVREIEAWMLVDDAVFARLGASDIELPADPERVLNPKAIVSNLLKRAHKPVRPARYYAFFGERVSLEALRRLPAFQAFERDLEAEVRALLPPGGTGTRP